MGDMGRTQIDLGLTIKVYRVLIPKPKLHGRTYSKGGLLFLKFNLEVI